MKTTRQSLIAALLLSLMAGSALAGTPGVDQRQDNQRARIAQGVASGELTAKETVRLAHGQKQLQRMENRAKADGVVTVRERARLHHKADKESAKIYHNKHDRQDRH